MRLLWLLGLTVVVIVAGSAGANVINWGGGSGTWNTAANWTGGIVPTTGDTAVIASGSPQVNATLSPAPDLVRVDGGTVRFTANNASSFVFNGGAIQAYDGTPTASGTFGLTSNLTITNSLGNSNRSLTISGAISEDATPRTVTFAGTTVDNTNISGTNTYSGGTIVTGQVAAQSGGALGTGPVAVNGGKLKLTYSGTYTFGQVTMASGTVAVQANGTVKGTNLNLQGGTVTYGASGNSSSTLDNTNTVAISNTVNINTTGGYWNGPFQIGASISGSAKAILGSTGQSRLVIGSTQRWTGGTEIGGVVYTNSSVSWGSSTGGVLPAGTVTVDALTHSSYANAILNLTNTTSGSNGGLNLNTDLALLSNAGVYGNLYLNANVTVRSLTLDGVVQPAGTYSYANLPSWIVSQSGTKTLTVTAPEPATLTLLVMAGVGLATRRRR